ncbi:MAG: hypothetical protein JWQ38_3608 [Flavipsychrobacter sp.]|nr:hypothetical protein [Flavipsychrobacter sp.]
MANNGLARKVNIFCLLAAIIAVLIFPLKKEIWYDETVSMLCSKGISHDTPEQLANTTTTSSAELAKLNTSENVFTATVLDNGNSFLYNISLHWFTGLFGNSIATYTLFSKLCTIALLIAFFLLCLLFMTDSFFVSIAVLLLAMDNMMGISHEIRAYAMGAFFITTAAIFFYKFTYQKASPLLLFLTGLFSVGAVLCHFLSVYIVLVFLGAMLYTKRTALFSVKNVLAMLLPIALIGIFFYCSAKGLQIMSKQNEKIAQAAQEFSMGKVLLLGMKYTAINFKAIFPAFIDKAIVIILSFLVVPALYLYGLRNTAIATQKRNLHLLFLLGISGSIFLSLLCLKSHHYTALYYRYFSFCIPFCCLFTTYVLYICAANSGISKAVKGGILSVITLPVVALFLMFLAKGNPKVKYNHIAVAGEIVRDHVTKIEVPEWSDALLIQCVLPDGYKIDYVRNPLTTNFTLYKAGNEEQVPVIKINS